MFAVTVSANAFGQDDASKRTDTASATADKQTDISAKSDQSLVVGVQLFRFSRTALAEAGIIARDARVGAILKDVRLARKEDLFDNTPLIGGGAVDADALKTLIVSLREKKLISLLSHPFLMTEDRQKASLLSGGTVDVPTRQGSGDWVDVQKTFGMELSVVPTLAGGQKSEFKMELRHTVLNRSLDAKCPSGKTIPGLETLSFIPAFDFKANETTAICLGSRRSMQHSYLVQPPVAKAPNSQATGAFAGNDLEFLIVVTPEVIAGE